MKIEPSGRRPAAALVSLALSAIAACGDGGRPPEPIATLGDAAVAPELECESRGFPCTWNAVDPAIVLRSHALAGQAAARLRDGASTKDVATWLKGEASGVVIERDDEQIRFRLPGGRPVWAARALPTLTDEPAAAPRRAAFAKPLAESSAASSGAAPRGFAAGKAVAGGAVRERSALVLSPFRYEGRTAFTAAAKVAEQLESTPSYGGNVAHKRNESIDAISVGVAEFADFNGYDVIHVSTHSARLCEELETGVVYAPCRLSVFAEPFDPAAPLALLGSTLPGVELVRIGDVAFLSVTADFFRSQYPGGLRDTLVYFDSCSSADVDVALALQGPDSVFLGWSTKVSHRFADATAEAMFEALSKGLSVRQAYAMVAQGSRDPRSGAELLHNDRDIHVRDLVTAVDAMTGAVVSNASRIELATVPGDGEPDRLLLSLFVDGMHPDAVAGQVVTVSMDGRPLASRPLSEGRVIADYRWQVDVAVPLGVDVRAGQLLDLGFSVNLVSGGSSTTLARPAVAGPGEPPAQWAMDIVYVSTGVGSSTTKRVQAIWTLEPGQRSDAPSLLYRVTSGTVTVEGTSDVAGCRLGWGTQYAIDPTTDSSTLRINRRGTPMSYEGQARTRAVPTTITGQCRGDAVSAQTDAGGLYFLNFGDLMNGQRAFTGTFDDGARLPTRISWSAQAR